MSINRKFSATTALAIAMFAFSAFVTAKEPTNSDAPPVKKDRMEKRGFGKRAEGMRGAMGRRRGHSILRFVRSIDLTDEQKSQIRSITGANRALFQAQREEVRGLIIKKRDNSITEAEQARLDQFKSDFRTRAEETKNAVRAILTPEQTARLEEMKAALQQRMQERMLKMKERRQQTEKSQSNK